MHFVIACFLLNQVNYINGEEGLSATNSIDFRKTFTNSLTECSSCDQGEEVGTDATIFFLS